MAPGYAVAIALEAVGVAGLVVALFRIRRERLSKAAGLRGHFGTGRRHGIFAPRIVSVSVQPNRAAADRGESVTAQAALRRALRAA